MAENLIEQYLTDIAEVHGTRSNVPETSFYSALNGDKYKTGKLTPMESPIRRASQS
jgi:hypothetical protein